MRPGVLVGAVFAFVASTGLAAGPPEAEAMAYLQEQWHSTGTPAISAAVASKGRIIFSAGVGYADLDNLVAANGSTVYNIGSVSKVITAVAVMQLVEQGKVSLDDPIRKFVPSFPEKPQGPITIRQIMTRLESHRALSHRATSYRLDGGLPLNYFYNDLTYKFASGGMLSSAEDLARFGEALSQGSLLRAPTVALMFHPQLDPVLRFVEGKPSGEKQEFTQGLMWRIFKDAAGRTFVNHCGSVKGFNACLVI